MSDGDPMGEPQELDPDTMKTLTMKTKKSKPPACSLPRRR